MICPACKSGRVSENDRYCSDCGAKMPAAAAPPDKAEITVTQTIAAGSEDVTGVEIGAVSGNVTMNVIQVNLPPDQLAEMLAVPTEVQPPRQASADGNPAAPPHREALKGAIAKVLKVAAEQGPRASRIQVGEVQLSQVDLLVKQAVLLETEADQMMLDMLSVNKDAVEQAKRGAGATFQLDLEEVMRGFDDDAHRAKLQEAYGLLREANRLEPANTEVLLHMVQVLDQLDTDGENLDEARKLLYRIQQLLKNPKDDVERFRLAQATFLSATIGEPVHHESLRSARAMFEKLGRVEWVEQCDLLLGGAGQGGGAAAAPAAPGPAGLADGGAFRPVGQWQVQTTDGAIIWLQIEASGGFQAAQQSAGFGFQAQGQWQFDPHSQTLQLQGLINQIQPFFLAITIQASQQGGFYGADVEGRGYLFQPL